MWQKMKYSKLIYKLPNDLGFLEFSSEALEHFENNKQRSCFSKEAGGQLFASYEGKNTADVTQVTGPRHKDWRSRFGYEPDLVSEKIEIAEKYKIGLHFVGDWHTHPQDIPYPSAADEYSMKKLVTESIHDLEGFIMVIVGRKPFPNGLHVSFHTATHAYKLEVI